MTTALRRTLFLVVLVAVGGTAYAWWSGRANLAGPAAAPEWPPLGIPPDTARTPNRAWVSAAPDGTCPDGFPVKVKESSGIFHVPGGRFHERTRPDRCYATAEAAEADGYRPSKS